ncbi:MAG TPA: helix-turn-helix transcriptional regulator [Streptosporangiaceae bacterium]|nr:helix-turn-helix transcriptional regulator [Streptosporangiaceae bacterium]
MKRQRAGETPQRLCVGCRATVLSRYNPDVLCAGCVRAARTPPGPGDEGRSPDGHIPAWLWDSPLLRDALSRLDLGAAMAIFRAAAGLSQQQLAQMLGCSQSSIWRIEAGERKTLYDIRELLRFADTIAMPRRMLLPLIMSASEAADTPDLGNTGPANRTATSSVVTEATMEYLRACACRLHAQEQAAGGATTREEALELWRRVARLADEADYTDDVGHELMHVAGELAIRAAWACLDSNQPARARSLFTDALQRASHAADDELAIHAMLSMSLLLTEMAPAAGAGLARQAIWLTAQAAGLARRHPSPRLHALIAAREALASAATGDAAGFKSAITRAWRELDRDQPDDDPPWLAFAGPAEIAVQEAKGRALLGSSAFYQNDLCDTGLSPRNAAIYQAQHAADLAVHGDLDQAVSEAAVVLDALEGPVASPRTLVRLRPVREAAGPAGFAGFCDRFDAVSWPGCS